MLTIRLWVGLRRKNLLIATSYISLYCDNTIVNDWRMGVVTCTNHSPFLLHIPLLHKTSQ